jgi:hypothetical protein
VSRSSTVFVDAVAPRVAFTLSGQRHRGSRIWVRVRDSDTPRRIPRADASGIASVKVKWGDGSRSRITHVQSHVYRRSRSYVVKVIVSDHAGNRTVKTRKLKITPSTGPTQ